MRGLLLDFDGVIVDSEHLHDVALREVCEPLGFSWQGDAWVGWPDAEVLIELHRRRGQPLPPSRLAQLLELKTRAVLQQVERGQYRAYPGVIELIREAAEAVPVVVCSAGTRKQIEPVLAFLGVAPLLTGLVAVEDTALSKPDPAPYLLAASRAGMSAQSCVAIEDSPRGVASALAAGCTVVAVAHTTPREMLSRAHRVVERVGDLTVPELSALAAERRER